MSPTWPRLKRSSRRRARTLSSAAVWLTINPLRLRLTSRTLTGMRWLTSCSRLPEAALPTWLLGRKPRSPRRLRIRPPLFCSRTSASMPPAGPLLRAGAEPGVLAATPPQAEDDVALLVLRLEDVDLDVVSGR